MSKCWTLEAQVLNFQILQVKWLYFYFLFAFQLRLFARDGADPPCVSEVPVTITIGVLKNNYVPYFVGEPFNGTVLENETINTQIVHVIARDRDPPVSA